MHSCLHLPEGNASIIILLQKEKHFRHSIQLLQHLSTCMASAEVKEERGPLLPVPNETAIGAQLLFYQCSIPGSEDKVLLASHLRNCIKLNYRQTSVTFFKDWGKYLWTYNTWKQQCGLAIHAFLTTQQCISGRQNEFRIKLILLSLKKKCEELEWVVSWKNSKRSTECRTAWQRWKISLWREN